VQKLQLFGEHEILKVVEYYCRYCEANPKLRKNAKQVLNGIADNLGQVCNCTLVFLILLKL